MSAQSVALHACKMTNLRGGGLRRLKVFGAVCDLIGQQEFAVVAQQLVANGGRAIVGCVVGHLGEDLASKVDAPNPAVVIIVTLVVHKSAMPNHFPVQAKDVNGRVIAAQEPHVSDVLHNLIMSRSQQILGEYSCPQLYIQSVP